MKGGVSLKVIVYFCARQLLAVIVQRALVINCLLGRVGRQTDPSDDCAGSVVRLRIANRRRGHEPTVDNLTEGQVTQHRPDVLGGSLHSFDHDGIQIRAIPVFANLISQRFEVRQHGGYLVLGRRILIDDVGEDFPELQRIREVHGACRLLRIGNLGHRIIIDRGCRRGLAGKLGETLYRDLSHDLLGRWQIRRVDDVDARLN